MFIGRTGLFLNTVSNRLAASSPRARFLGMLIGTTISQLIEQQGKGMRFDLEEMESDEAHWYLDLAKLHDSVGSIESIKSLRGPPATTEKDTKHRTSRTNIPKKDTRRAKIVAIEEVNDSDQEDEEDEDLIPYEKPDEDPSDSDDDPTLVQRNKPTAPVYVTKRTVTHMATNHELGTSATL